MSSIDSKIILKEEIESFKAELIKNGLIDTLNRELNVFSEINGISLNGKAYGAGTIDISEAIIIYSLIRKYKPKILVETGVCNGFSTAFMLLAIEMNKTGHLYSIDFPEEIGIEYDKNIFWKGKGGASIPYGKISGWIIPNYLKNNWTLFIGKSQDIFANILSDLGIINFVLLDSEHSYECMYMEMNLSHKNLDKGFLIIDDIHHNDSFIDFCDKNNLHAQTISNHMGLISKGI